MLRSYLMPSPRNVQRRRIRKALRCIVQRAKSSVTAASSLARGSSRRIFTRTPYSSKSRLFSGPLRSLIMASYALPAIVSSRQYDSIRGIPVKENLTDSGVMMVIRSSCGSAVKPFAFRRCATAKKVVASVAPLKVASSSFVSLRLHSSIRRFRLSFSAAWSSISTLGDCQRRLRCAPNFKQAQEPLPSVPQALPSVPQPAHDLVPQPNHPLTLSHRPPLDAP